MQYLAKHNGYFEVKKVAFFFFSFFLKSYIVDVRLNQGSKTIYVLFKKTNKQTKTYFIPLAEIQVIQYCMGRLVLRDQRLVDGADACGPGNIM